VRAMALEPLMGVRWEEDLDKSLDVWRKELDVGPFGAARTAGTKCSSTSSSSPPALDP